MRGKTQRHRLGSVGAPADHEACLVAINALRVNLVEAVDRFKGEPLNQRERILAVLICYLRLRAWNAAAGRLLAAKPGSGA